LLGARHDRHRRHDHDGRRGPVVATRRKRLPGGLGSHGQRHTRLVGCVPGLRARATAATTRAVSSGLSEPRLRREPRESEPPLSLSARAALDAALRNSAASSTLARPDRRVAPLAPLSTTGRTATDAERIAPQEHRVDKPDIEDGINQLVPPPPPPLRLQYFAQLHRLVHRLRRRHVRRPRRVGGDLARTTASGRAAAEGARAEYEQSGIAIAQLRRAGGARARRNGACGLRESLPPTVRRSVRNGLRPQARLRRPSATDLRRVRRPASPSTRAESDRLPARPPAHA
jgi:hypothetical protein